MPELTPEVLEELESCISAAPIETWSAESVDTDVGDSAVLHGPRWYWPTRDSEVIFAASDEAKLIVALHNHAPALIAAARERDELKALFEEHKAQSEYKRIVLAELFYQVSKENEQLKARLAEMNDNSHPCFYCGEWMVNHIGENLMCENCGVDQSAAHTSTQERLKRLEWEGPSAQKAIAKAEGRDE